MHTHTYYNMPDRTARRIARRVIRRVARAIRAVDPLTFAAVIGAVVTLAVWGFGVFAADCRRVQDDLFRLHIVANSDAPADQTLKLELRDYLLREVSFPQSYTKSEAIAAARATLPQITAKANEFLRERNKPYTATAEITNMYFNTRRYDGFLVPAGSYDALRVTLGSGGGQNWWCVLFPPLCLPAAGERAATATTTAAATRLEPYMGGRVASEMSGVTVKFALYEGLLGLFSR